MHEADVPDERKLAISFPPVLKLFWILIVAMTVVSVGFTLIMSYVFHRAYPYGLPFIRMDVRGWDFIVFHDRFAHFGDPGFWGPFPFPFTYPAPLAVVFGVLYKLAHPVRDYLLILFIALLCGTVVFVRRMIARGIRPWVAIAFTLTILATSWPLLVLFQRANIEGVVIVIVASAVLCILGGRPWLAATLIGIAGAMKIFPLVLAALLLSRRRYKELAWSLLVVVLVTLGSLTILGPTPRIAQRNVDDGLLYFKQRFAANPDRRDFGEEHSLFTLVKLYTIPSQHFTEPYASDDVYHPERGAAVRSILLSRLNIYLACAAVFGIAAYFLRIRRLPMLNQVFALIICAVLLPPISFDYTLPHLLLPCALLCLYAVDTARQGTRPPGLMVCLVCLSIIFTLGTYFVWDVRLSGQARALALLTLFATVLYFPFPWSRLDALGRPAPVELS